MPDRLLENATVTLPGVHATGKEKDVSVRLGKLLGAGGQAAVYRTDTALPLAVKVYDPFEDGNKAQRESFDFEGRLVRWNHENIIRVAWQGMGRLAVGKTVEVERPLSLMDYAEEGSLRDLLTQQRKQGKKTLEPLHAASILEKIVKGTAYAHTQKVMHGDIKPANILMHEGKPKLTDFGIATVLRHADSHIPTPAFVRGSFAYMAPEAFAGKNVEQSDIYSIGVVGYQLLTGELPFTYDSLEAVMQAHKYELPPAFKHISGIDHNNEVLRQLEPIIRKALEKDPLKRYKSMAEFDEVVGVAFAKLISEARTDRYNTQKAPSPPPTPPAEPLAKTRPYTEWKEPSAPKKVSPRVPKPDRKVAGGPRKTGPGEPPAPRANPRRYGPQASRPAGSGDPKPQPKAADGPGGPGGRPGKREGKGIDWFDPQESKTTRRKVLEMLGWSTAAALGGGAVLSGVGLEKGWTLEAKPYPGTSLELDKSTRVDLQRIGRELMNFAVDLKKGWPIDNLLEVQGQFNPEASVLAAQSLLRRGDMPGAAYAAITTAPYNPNQAKRIVQLMQPHFKKGEDLNYNLLLAAASIAPYQPDEMRAFIREYKPDLIQRFTMDTIIDPDSAAEKVNGALYKMSNYKDEQATILETFRTRIAAVAPDKLIEHIESLPRKTIDDYAWAAQLAGSLIPYRPQYAWQFMDELSKHPGAEFENMYGRLGIKFAPYHPHVTETALKHLQEKNSGSGTIDFMKIALIPHKPRLAREVYKRLHAEKNSSLFWKNVYTLAFFPSNQPALESLMKYFRNDSRASVDVVNFANALFAAHSRKV